MTKQTQDKIVIYKDTSGPQVEVRLGSGNIWLSQAQIAALFDTDRTSITRHLNNILKSGELVEKSNVQFLHIAGSDRPVKFYNLDFIISVGYRVNSKRATQFRQWATKRLRELVLKGYVIETKRLKDRAEVRLRELEDAIKLFRQAVMSKRLAGYERELLNIINDYTDTWITLNRYDNRSLKIEKVTKKALVRLDYAAVKQNIVRFKERLQKAGEATELFGKEVGEKLRSALGAIHQTFDAVDVYPSVEEKAAHLLYFVIKDHPFADGNKRIGSLLFLFYLVENRALYNKKGERKIESSALTTLALLVAESRPEQKDIMVKLIVNLINN